MRSGKTARDNVILEAAMEKEVIISIKGMQKYENAEPDTIELVTGGVWSGTARALPCLIRRAPSPAWTGP